MSETQTANMTLIDANMAEILADTTFNCRGVITPLDVIDLSRSMQTNGLQQPIIIQSYKVEEMPHIKWRIVCGHRRHKAAKVLNWQTIPAIVREGLSEVQALTENLIENLERKQLNILQEAKAINNMKCAGMSQADVGQMVGQSRGWAQVRFFLLELPDAVQQEAAAGRITSQQIRDLHALTNDEERYEMVKQIKDAKERGEKTPSLKKKPKSLMSKRPRTRAEMFEMMDHIQEFLGNNLGTRALAWAAGEIADHDFYRDIGDLAKSKGVAYEIPQEVMPAMHYGANANSK